MYRQVNLGKITTILIQLYSDNTSMTLCTRSSSRTIILLIIYMLVFLLEAYEIVPIGLTLIVYIACVPVDIEAYEIVTIGLALIVYELYLDRYESGSRFRSRAFIAWRLIRCNYKRIEYSGTNHQCFPKV